jgi:hypothetical protein
MGDSLFKINNNAANFDTRIDNLSSTTNTQINNLSTYATGTALLSSNGYQILPGGLIMQWGESGSLTSDGNQTLTFPIPFPNSCLKAFVTLKNSSTTNDDSFARVITYNSTQIVVRSEYTGGGGISGTRFIDYLAIGY